MYTIIPYHYVDASNYKQFGEIALNGELSPADRTAITQRLVDKSLFIPFDLNLSIPELQRRMDGFPSDDDHVFHELKIDRIQTQTTRPDSEVLLDRNDFLAAFERIQAADSWDVIAAVNRLGL